jgi:SAM-dependent methyltransferase
VTASSLTEIVDRPPLELIKPSKIPWHDPEFSRRMLREHLDQRHDHASRRLETVDAHVEWLFTTVLAGRPGSVLDLGCGPGLYTERLAERGCSCLGVDISPASIEYARQVADEKGLDCTYLRADIFEAYLGSGHDLAMLLFGELNTFPKTEVPDLIRRARDALRPGGTLVLEVHTHESVVREGSSPPEWWTSEGGLFAPGPHIVLQEQRWLEETATTASRSFVLDASTGQVETYSETLAAYTDDQYRALLDVAGFTQVEIHPTFGGTAHPDLMVIAARRAVER